MPDIHDLGATFLGASAPNEMIWTLIFSVTFWILTSIENSQGSDEETEHFFEKKKRPVPRGYHGGVGFPYLPFAEPLTILAGLAFIAYLIQAFHTLFHNHHAGLGGIGGGGGLLNNVLPSKGKDLFSKEDENIIKLLD